MSYSFNNALDYSNSDSILAIATSLNIQALSIIRGSGFSCIELLSYVFSNPEKLRSSKGGRTHVGWIVDEGQKIDQVVVCVYKAPKSFTGEDQIEIILHGGVYITLCVYRLLLKKGFREAKNGEFSFRAFLNGKINLTQAEGIKALICAKTEMEARLAQSQIDNVFFNCIKNIKEKLITLMGMLDASIEYPEEEIEFDEVSFFSSLDDILHELSSLLERWKRDKIFMEGVKIVIAGRPNAGKSSLFNALVNEQRSIVADTAGTTRDYIDSTVLFNGLAVRLYDTAGLRDAKDKIEMEGVMRTQKIIGEASLIFYLIDASSPLSQEDESFLDTHLKRTLVIFTKNDIFLPDDKLKNKVKELGIREENIISISTKTQNGIEGLIKRSYEFFVGLNTGESTGEAIISERQRQLIFQAKDFLLSVQKKQILAFDIVLQHIQDALSCFGEITGEEVGANDVLDSVFSSFCVGK